MQRLSIIDTIGPFTIKVGGDTINWSKVHFPELEKNGRLPLGIQKEIASRFETFLQKVHGLGYNSLSIDDVAHLAIMPFYQTDLKQLLQDYRQLYKTLFAIAKKQGMGIYVNTDYLFFNNEIETYLAQKRLKPDDLFLEILEKTFHDFPEIDGVILRIGENDGKDVDGAFLSRLVLKTPRRSKQTAA